MLFSSVDNIIYEQIELYATSYLVKEMVISYCTFVNLYQKFKLHLSSKQFIFKKQKGEKGSSLDKGTNTLSLFCYNETNF